MALNDLQWGRVRYRWRDFKSLLSNRETASFKLRAAAARGIKKATRSCAAISYQPWAMDTSRSSVADETNLAPQFPTR
jgi:hypothetical protein